jgi:predicted nucleic-acid-binding protein
MIGIDTNLLLRLFETADHPLQTAAARRAIETHAPVFVSATVLVEFVWTLRRIFKINRAGIHARLASIVKSPEFSVAFAQQTTRAVELYGAGPADFPDYLLGEHNLAQGCEATLTFDRNAAKNPAFRRLREGT